MINAILSEDGANVIVFNSGSEEPEDFTVAEFIAIYGEDALPVANPPAETNIEAASERAQNESIFIRYYDSLERLVDAVGSSMWATKLEANCADGVFPVQRVAYDYFGGHESASRIPLMVQEKLNFVRSSMKSFDHWSQKVGFKPMSERDQAVLAKHLSDKNFRRRFRYRVRKYSDKHELISVRDLVIETLKSAKRTKPTEGD